MIIQNIILNKLILPEMLIAGFACFILLTDVFISQRYRIVTYVLTQFSLLVVIFSIYGNFKNLLNVQNFQEENIFLIDNGFILNLQINFLKLIIACFMFIIFVYAKDYLKSKNYFCGEYFVLNLLSMLGVMMLISSRHFFNFYFGIEMFSLPIYALIALESQPANLEASLKYFILGAIFSGILLYGLSLIYGASGSLDFKSIVNFIETQHISMLFNVGVTLVLIGIFFKLNLVPVHMWAPDTYQGAPTVVTMLIATLPKIAMISIFSHLLYDVFPKYINYNWQILLITVSILSMFIGNIGAVLQNNIKRLLAYSAIGHTGFMVLGLAVNSSLGKTAANFYVVLYALMAVGVFGIIVIFSKNNMDFDNIKDFSGLSKKHPWLSGMLLILLLSMVGIPPTAGFYAKFLIIKALIDVNLMWVAVVALLLSVVSLFYYLKIIKAMYFVDIMDITNDSYNNTTYSKQKINWSSMAVLSVNGIVVLGLGVFPVFINSILMYFKI